MQKRLLFLSFRDMIYGVIDLYGGSYVFAR